MGRTKKNIQLKTPEKPRKIKGFRSGSYQIATTISSQPRYDHFDIPPCKGVLRLVRRITQERIVSAVIFHHRYESESRKPKTHAYA